MTTSIRTFGWLEKDTPPDLNDVSVWVFPAGSFTPPAAMVLGAHPGAGTSTWAAALGITEHGPEAHEVPAAGALIGVFRTTFEGVDAARDLVGRAGPGRITAFLAVADAPGKPPLPVRREIKVIAGGVPVVPVPWIPGLRGQRGGDTAAERIPPKALAKTLTGLAGQGVAVTPGVPVLEQEKESNESAFDDKEQGTHEQHGE